MAIKVSKKRVSLEDIPLYSSKVTLSSASTVDLSLATGNYVHISGSGGPISSFGTVPAGSTFNLFFEGSPTIIYHATQMNLSTGGSNYSVSAGDRAVAVSEGFGNWTVTIFKKAITSITNSSGVLITGTSSRSLASTDNGCVISLSSVNPIIITIPSGLPTGFGCAIFQASSGQISFSTSGTTIIPSTTGHSKTAGQGKMVALIQVAQDTYCLCGGTA